MEAFSQLGYRPNSVARSLKKQRTQTIGVIIPDITEGIFARMLKGMDYVISEAGYSIILCDSNEDPRKEERLFNILCEGRVEGMIIATVQDNDQIDGLLSKSHPPIVFVDNVPNTSNGFDSVSLDNVRASFQAVDHLICQGHRSIAGIMGKQTEHTGFDRYTGYSKAFAKYSIPLNPALVRFGDFKEQSGYEAMLDLISSGIPFTAVYIASSKMTYGAIAAIRECGLRIPQDISLVGFDVYDEYDLMFPRISTVLQPVQDIGTVAARLLLQRLNENNGVTDLYQHIVLDPQLVIAESSSLRSEPERLKIL